MCFVSRIVSSFWQLLAHRLVSFLSERVFLANNCVSVCGDDCWNSSRALGLRPRWRRAAFKPEPVEELRKQADIAVRVLDVFKKAALLLDEVPRGRVLDFLRSAFLSRAKSTDVQDYIDRK